MGFWKGHELYMRICSLFDYERIDVDALVLGAAIAIANA
jgi:hypothetical protein